MRTWFSRSFMQTPTHRKITWMKSTQIWLKRLLGENTLPNRSPEMYKAPVASSERSKQPYGNVYTEPVAPVTPA
jgi:hypothetical protein